MDLVLDQSVQSGQSFGTALHALASCVHKDHPDELPLALQLRPAFVKQLHPCCNAIAVSLEPPRDIAQLLEPRVDLEGLQR